MSLLSGVWQLRMEVRDKVWAAAMLLMFAAFLWWVVSSAIS
jgi:hypothetical protein